MYSKKPPSSTQNLQIKSVRSKSNAAAAPDNKTEIERSRPTIGELQKPEIYKPDSKSKLNRKKVKIGAFDDEVISSVVADDKENDKPVIKGEKIDLEPRQTNPISEVIKELTIDLRHERLVSNADWSETSNVDLEHFNYSSDYSAFLSSYE